MGPQAEFCGNLVARMSAYHAPCRACEWPVAKNLLDTNGWCSSCRRTAKQNGVTDEQIRKVERIYARCV